MEIITYILTHNAPNRLVTCLQKLRKADPQFFAARLIVVDQSTQDDAIAQNKQTAAAEGVDYVKNVNLGASGGRWYCAQHFHDTSADAMFYFEDDLIWNDGSVQPRNGIRIPINVKTPFSTAVACLQHAKLDFLKLTFHEYWAAHNVDRGAADSPRARYTIEDAVDQMFFVGDVYYSNWPMLITKRASQLIFAGAPMSEGDYVVRAHQLRISGKLKVGVFAAEPIYHLCEYDNRQDKCDLRLP